MNALRVGDVVTVRSGFGQELPEQVTVDGIGEEAGQTVIDYLDGHGCRRWAYLSQIVEEAHPVDVEAQQHVENAQGEAA